ncbi:MAG: DUF1015 domain-containing protein [Armatimonadetes bacterium]|nr:DUF1015 domain-containing protein [Armatimonadota bacterium]MDW8122268.1 DUF1015 domain-containing protein [Armatimonadota bacterium]
MNRLWTAPFQPITFNPALGDLSKLIAPPYDVIDDKMAKSLLERHPFNAVRLIVPKPLAQQLKDPYQTASRLWAQWIKEEILIPWDKECIFIYSQRFPWRGREREQRALLCPVPLMESDDGPIRPHEQTVQSAIDDRLALLKATWAEHSQIYALIEGDERWACFLRATSTAPPSLQAQDETCLHCAWVVDDPSFIQEVSDYLSDKWLIIADGHHRYRTAVTFARSLPSSASHTDPARYIGAIIADGRTDTTVIPTHRILRFQRAELKDRFLAQIRRRFFTQNVCDPITDETIDGLLSGDQRSSFLFTSCGETCLVTVTGLESAVNQALSSVADAFKKVPTAVLHLGLLPVTLSSLGIKQEEVSIAYTHSVQEALAHSADAGSVAILVPPLKAEEVMAIARQGLVLPPKTTYFFPKTPSGFVMRSLKPI